MEGDGGSRGVSAKRGILRGGMIPLVAASFLMPAVAAGPAAAAMANGTIHIVSVGALSMAQNDVVITGVFGDAGTFAVGKSPVVPLHLSKGTLKINFAKGAAAEGAVFAHLSKCGVLQFLLRNRWRHRILRGSPRQCQNDVITHRGLPAVRERQVQLGGE